MDDQMLIKFIEVPDVGDCIAVTANGQRIKIDPFAGCAWDWENKDALFGTVFVLSNLYQNADGVYLPNENQLRFAGFAEIEAEARAEALKNAVERLKKCPCVNGNETEVRREDAIAAILEGEPKEE